MCRWLTSWVVMITTLIPFRNVGAQFPRLCATREAYFSRECCPRISEVGSPCGEDQDRGLCANIVADTEPWSGPYNMNGIDDREQWPLRFFNRLVSLVDRHVYIILKRTDLIAFLYGRYLPVPKRTESQENPKL